MSEVIKGAREEAVLLFKEDNENGANINYVYGSVFGRLITETLFSAYFLGQGIAVIPQLAAPMLAFPGSVLLLAWIWAASVVLVSPLRLWSNARARETDFRRRLSREHTRRAPYRDLSTRRPFHLLWVGRLLKLAGALMIIGGLVYVSFFVFTLPLRYDAKGLLHMAPSELHMMRLVVLLSGATLIYLGHRFARRDGRRALVKDRRAPIVYLRPFVIDGRYNFNPSGLLAQQLGLAPFGFFRVLGPFGNLHPLRLARLFFGSTGEHSEEQMARYFHRYGPFVAIGKPGEMIPQTGALRLFVGNAEWRVTVDELLSRAAIVVLQPSDSEGIRWEVERVLNTVAPQRVLICLQLFDGRQGRYDQFRIWVEESVGIKLPRSLGNSMFVFFDENWQARGLPSRMRLPVFWPLASCAVNFKRTLSPFLTSLAGTRAKARTRPAKGVSRAFLATIALVFWSLVLSAPVRLFDLLAVTTGVEAFGFRHEANDGRWVWQLPAAWQQVKPDEYKFTAEFERVEDGKSLGDILLKIEEVPPGWTSLERVADARQENLQNKGFVPITKKRITSGRFEWVETEYRTTSDDKAQYLIMRIALPGRQMVSIIGSYDEIPSDDQENDRRHRKTIEAFVGFSWEAPTAVPAITP